MPENGFFYISSSSVMEEAGMLGYCFYETYSPERSGAPLFTRGFIVWTVVSESVSHIVE
ncbi:MAG: hypothetical protein ACJAR1_000364 [Rubritalea sp.]|jgi:hypothetical protein